MKTKDRTELDTGPTEIFADLEATLEQVAETNPRISDEATEPGKNMHDLRALLEVSLATNSSLVLDDVLQIVMHKAIELMKAERGLIMLLDEKGELQTRCAFNLCKEEMNQDDFQISNSIAYEVARTGKSKYISDALSDKKYAQQKSIIEMHLHSIMCVPVIIKEKVIGIIYLDNSIETRMFLKSDLYIFELYGQMVSNALHNAEIYESLLVMQRYNESVIEKSPIGLVVLDSNACISKINSVALEILELNKSQIKFGGDDSKGTAFLDILPEKEKPRWQFMIETVLSSNEDFSESRYFHNTGYDEKALSIKISPISHLPGGGDGIVMTIEDTTEKVIMEKYVILSEKLVAKGEMAASIAHELNNYLAIASNNAELLSMNVEKKSYDKAKFNASSIVDNVFKIKRFVDSMMDFSKPETEYVSYNMKHLIEDLLFSLRVQPRFKSINFSLDIAHDIPNIEMDVGQIQQVLMNLLNNGADATEERALAEQKAGNTYKRELTIKANYIKASEKITLEISDNGIGMSKETMKKLFSLHFTTKKNGHGLGLVNCQKIIEQHQGKIVPESKPGEGTTFAISLPRQQRK
ncbi:MAG: GAF domain-containing protein [candidate division Zixibacteria bacterium]|nr:GAF domain-containing protein [candidate division Zixibacteria bacterium]